MKTLFRIALCTGTLAMQLSATAQNPAPLADQTSLLRSTDPVLAANKKLVYDFWREVLEAGHLELADKYMMENYVQHNPNVPTGRKGFVEFFTKIRKPQPIANEIKGTLIAIVAEGDRVVLVFNHDLPDPKDASKRYTTASFEMLRIENGKIAEHWDNATKQ
jgi:predicted SnoaL-like aldol condensation-catalyzing enzyme